MEQIVLDLIPGKMPPVAHCSQYDVGRVIRINLVEGGTAYALTSGTTVEVHVKKTDGNIVTASLLYTTNNTYVDLVTTEQMTACYGMNIADLTITKNSQVIGTLNFILSVEQDPLDGGHASDSEIYNITQLVNTAMAGSSYVTELEDIRNGDNGFVYASAGNAVRAGAREIDDLPFCILHTDEITDGHYFGSDGTINSITGWSISPFLKINNEADYYIKTRVTSPNVFSCFYDSTRTFLSSFQTDVAGANHLTAPSGAKYVRFSIQTADKSYFTYSSKIVLPYEIDAVDNPRLIKGTKLVATYRDFLITGSYYNTSGNPQNSANWSRTLIYPVKTGDEIAITNAQGNYAVLFDSSMAYIETKGTTNTPQDVSFTITGTAAFVGLNIVNANLTGYTATVNGQTIGSLYSVDWLDAKKSIWFNKTYISHGDSITWQDGRNWASGPDQGTKARGYQTIFSETVGLASYKNEGKSGWSMAVVNGNGVVNTILNVSSYAIYNLCTIACGTNDFKLDVPLGTLGQIGDATFDDATFYGAYRKAVEYILTSSPTIRLVLMTPLQRDNSGYDVNHVNGAGCKLIDYVNAVKEVGAMYGLPVCDMYAESGFTKLTLSTYTLDGLHPNTNGYIRMGNFLTDYLETVGN